MMGPHTLFSQRLIELWPHNSLDQLAMALGRSRTTVRARAIKLGLKPKRLQRLGRTEPPASAWINAASHEAREAGLRPNLVLAGCRHREFAFARARAFKTVLDAHPNCSIAGLGRVSGFDHTTILAGVRRHEERMRL